MGRTHRVLVLNGTADDVGVDFKVAVGVSREALGRRDAVLVDNAKMRPLIALFLRVVIVSEGERVVAIEPANVTVSALV